MDDTDYTYQHGFFKKGSGIMSKVNQRAWDQEYRKPQLISLDTEPTHGVTKFYKWLKKSHQWFPFGKKVLDIGAGIGRHAIYFQNLGARVTTLEFAENAVTQLKRIHPPIQVLEQSMTSPFPLDNDSQDLVIDNISSNSLLPTEFQAYLQEVARVSKPGSFFYLRTLALEGDRNAQQLLEKSPGPEPKTYLLPGIGVTERVSTLADLKEALSPSFDILETSKHVHYQNISGQKYKRKYWIIYARRRV